MRGSPNTARRHLSALDALVETDWLDFPFTMNWRFTRAGTVRFEKGEPFCFITPVPHAILDDIQPVVRDLASDPELEAAYRSRSNGRNAFNAGLAARDPEIVAQGWQRYYVRGEDAGGRLASFHRTKRRLRPPRTE